MQSWIEIIIFQIILSELFLLFKMIDECIVLIIAVRISAFSFTEDFFQTLIIIIIILSLLFFYINNRSKARIYV